MFEYFPKVWVSHSTNKSVPIQFTDICRRVSIPKKYKEDASLFMEYVLRDGENVMDVAERIYDDASLWWLILLTNDIHDPVNQLPFDGEDYDTIIREQYTEDELNTVVEVLDRRGNKTDLVAVRWTRDPEPVITTDSMTDEELVERFGLRPVTLYDKLVAENDALRRIKILDPDYVTTVKAQLEKLINE